MFLVLSTCRQFYVCVITSVHMVRKVREKSIKSYVGQGELEKVGNFFLKGLEVREEF